MTSQRVLVLSRREVAKLLPPVAEQLDWVERTYRALERGEVEQPPKPGIHPREDCFIHAMPAYLRRDDVAVLKWVAGYKSNPARGLPFISGVIVLNDPATGLPIAIMDAAEITAARTAAASGLCVRRFAPEGWSTAAILGCGEQGRYHARLLEALNPGVTIRAYDPDPDRRRSIPGAVPCSEPRAAVEGAEVVVTAGPIVRDPEPALAPEWPAPEHLLLPIDFDFAVQPETIAAADLFLVDDEDQFAYYRELGHFRGWRAPDGALGRALAGSSQGRRVACVNLGVGALDATFGAGVLSRAREQGAGTQVEL
jgi:alanine dehydrogenase